MNEGNGRGEDGMRGRGRNDGEKGRGILEGREDGKEGDDRRTEEESIV